MIFQTPHYHGKALEAPRRSQHNDITFCYFWYFMNRGLQREQCPVSTPVNSIPAHLSQVMLFHRARCVCLPRAAIRALPIRWVTARQRRMTRQCPGSARHAEVYGRRAHRCRAHVAHLGLRRAEAATRPTGPREPQLVHHLRHFRQSGRPRLRFLGAAMRVCARSARSMVDGTVRASSTAPGRSSCTWRRFPGKRASAVKQGKGAKAARRPAVDGPE